MLWHGTHNKWLCNPDKTEGIQFISRFVRHPIIRDFLLGDTTVYISDRVCNRSVIMNKELNLSHHHRLNVTSKRDTLPLRSIARLRKELSRGHLEMLINAFVVSHLDYSNSDYRHGGLPKRVTVKLQSIQNSAARLISWIRLSDRITPVLKHFHWLPVEARIVFKVLFLT